MSDSATALSEVDDYLAERIRQPYPDGCHVVPGSTPVVSFGDVRTAWVATLALNPSVREFTNRTGGWLTGEHRRLEGLDSLGIVRTEDATDEHVQRIVEGCYRYFDANPYWGWFRSLEGVLRDSVGASYEDGSAAHLDLVQWATDPVWGKIPEAAVRRRLIEADREFLRRQLRTEGIRLVLMNGARVMKEVSAMGVPLEVLDVPQVGRSTFTMHSGHSDGALFVGWNKVFPQGAISHAQRALIVDTVSQMAGGLVPTPKEQDMSATIAKGTHVSSKAELVQLLETWLGTEEKTIGDVGAFSGRPWIHVRFGDVEFVLNADTKRTAVQEFVADAKARGAEVPWTVVANARGRVNKVVYREDGVAAPGWYGYTTEPVTSGTIL